jgi:hypothetical protein
MMESRLLLNAVRYSKIMVAATLTTALPTLFLEDPTNYAQELIEAKQQMQIEGNRNFDSVLKNPHVVGELLRYYLANCPSALFTSAQYDAWLIVAMVKAPMERIRSISRFWHNFLSRTEAPSKKFLPSSTPSTPPRPGLPPPLPSGRAIRSSYLSAGAENCTT